MAPASKGALLNIHYYYYKMKYGKNNVTKKACIDLEKENETYLNPVVD
jgi:hypothetical protein